MTMGTTTQHRFRAAPPPPVAMAATVAAPASALDAATEPYRLTFNRRPFALPAFRTLLYVDGMLNSPSIRQAVHGLLDAFLKLCASDVAWVMIGDQRREMKAQAFNDSSASELRRWIDAPEHPRPASARLNGPMDSQMQAPTLPHFRVDQDRYVLIEISLPDTVDEPDKIGFADEVERLLARLPVICGVIGNGFYVPAMIETLGTLVLPKAFPRYRTAIEVQIRGPVRGLRRSRAKGVKPWSQNPELKGGIADIGWRTLVGEEFLERIELWPAPPSGIEVRNSDHFIVLPAGQSPIWGDVNLGEDIAAYRGIASLLKPIRFPIEVGSLFGSQTANPDGRDRVEAYLARFDDEVQT